MKNFKMKLRISLWTLLGLAVFYFIFYAVSPFGKTVYESDFSSAGMIGKLTPEERREAGAYGGWRMIGDPLYFSIRTFRGFDRAAVELEYENKSEKPIIEIGVLADKTVWRYQLKPAENAVIDRLASKWTALRKGSLLLLQKRKEYESIDDFIANPPELSRIALYDTELNSEFTIGNYAPSASKTEIGRPLRGNYEFYVYLKNEPLDFEFSFFDLNQNKDPDPVEINLYYRDQPIDSVRVEDDGIAEDGGISSAPRKISLKAASLPEGVYKIEFKTGNDVITEKIISNQKRISFRGPLWLTEDNENFEIRTDSSAISVNAVHPAGRQVVKFGTAELDVDETYRQFNLSAIGDTIGFERGGVILSGDGVFSFDRESFFDPEAKKIDSNFNSDSVDFILANYRSPEEANGGFKTARAEFELKQAYREDGAYGFIISAPGLKVEDGTEDYIIIKSVRVEFYGRSLWAKIKSMIDNRL